MRMTHIVWLLLKMLALLGVIGSAACSSSRVEVGVLAGCWIARNSALELDVIELAEDGTFTQFRRDNNIEAQNSGVWTLQVLESDSLLPFSSSNYFLEIEGLALRGFECRSPSGQSCLSLNGEVPSELMSQIGRGLNGKLRLLVDADLGYYYSQTPCVRAGIVRGTGLKAADPGT